MRCRMLKVIIYNLKKADGHACHQVTLAAVINSNWIWFGKTLRGFIPHGLSPWKRKRDKVGKTARTDFHYSAEQRQHSQAQAKVKPFLLLWKHINPPNFETISIPHFKTNTFKCFYEENYSEILCVKCCHLETLLGIIVNCLILTLPVKTN